MEKEYVKASITRKYWLLSMNEKVVAINEQLPIFYHKKDAIRIAKQHGCTEFTVTPIYML